MVKTYFKILFLFFIFALTNTFGQNPYSIEFNEVKGNLKTNSKVKKDFGKYVGYTFPLFEGETANFALLTSQFDGKLVLVDPKGKVYKQSGAENDELALIYTTIPISGDWVLYVVGGIKENGNYNLRYAFAPQTSMNFNQNLDFCSSVNLLIAHSEAHFMMLPMDQLQKNGLELLSKSKVSFVEKDATLLIEFYSGADFTIAKSELDNYVNQLQNCLPDWEKSYKQRGTDYLEYISFSKKNELEITIELGIRKDITRDNKISYTVFLKM